MFRNYLDMKKCDNQEKAATAIDLSALLDLIMSPGGSSYGVFGDINLEGRNNGAVMNARRSRCCGESSESCGINVYINNNVQGVCNSILVGSEVNMGDPGVYLSLKSGRNFLQGSKKESSISTDFGLYWPWGLIFVFASLLWLLN